jgi:hypothetical protein
MRKTCVMTPYCPGLTQGPLYIPLSGFNEKRMHYLFCEVQELQDVLSLAIPV